MLQVNDRVLVPRMCIEEVLDVWAIFVSENR